VLQSQVTWGHSAFIFNEHIGASAMVVDETKTSDTFKLSQRTFDPAFRDGRDPYHLTQGGALGRVHKGLGSLSLRGRLIVPDTTQLQRLADRELAFRAAFDPDVCYRDSPTTDGAYALAWREWTGDTTNFASGKRPVQLFCRPAGSPQLVERTEDRSSREFAVSLIAADPRLYAQTESVLNLSPGTPSGALANIGTVKAPLKMTIVTSGSGSATFTLTRSGVSFGLDLSAVGAVTIVVVFETCGPYLRGRLITVNGVENFTIKNTNPDTWLDVPVGSTTFTIANTTNITACTLATYSTWA
jgi:hypothetical protein